MTPPPQRDRREILTMIVLLEGSLGLIAWGAAWASGRILSEDLIWRPGTASLAIAATVPLYFAFLAVTRWPTRGFARIARVLDESMLPMFRKLGWIDLAIVAAFAGWGEELLFRAIVQDALVESLGVVGGVALASLAFGLVHAVTPTYFVAATSIGAYLGVLRIATDGLWAPVLVHALYDFLAFVHLVKLNWPVPAWTFDEPPPAGDGAEPENPGDSAS